MNPSVNNSSVPPGPPAMPPTPTKTPEKGATFKKFLPATAFFVAFFLSMTLLLIYMDNTGKFYNKLL